MNLRIARSRMVSKAATRESFNRLDHYRNGNVYSCYEAMEILSTQAGV
jgi:hypothetical protein